MSDDEPFWKKYGYPSYEAMIEAKAGSLQKELDWDARVYGAAYLKVDQEGNVTRIPAKDIHDWPMPEPPPYPADDEGLARPDFADKTYLEALAEEREKLANKAIKNHPTRHTKDP